MNIDKLTMIAKAAGFAMATPDEDELASVPRRPEVGAWRSAEPRPVARSLIVMKPVQQSAALRDWFALFLGRAPA